MKNKWITFFTGRVLVKAEGQGIERLLNKMVRNGLNIWQVKRYREDAVRFYIGLDDLRKLRRAARNASCSLHLVKGEGVPFYWKRMMKNIGFPIGMMGFFLVILLLSNVTWDIQIQGADPETEHQIREELTQLGIRQGTFHFLANKPDEIQKQITDKMENITWIGIELKGTIYRFQVVQKNEPEKAKAAGPRDLVANKRAVISDMFVEKGMPAVKVNDYVEKGQLLVSGNIGSAESPKHVIAKGEVLGKTWYQTEVEVPVEKAIAVLSGESMDKYRVRVGKWTVPVWGFGKVEYEQYETEVIAHDLFLLGRKVPIQFEVVTFRENEVMNRSFTVEEARDAALLLARKDVEHTIPAEATIEKEIILQEKVDNGKVKLSIHYQVVENIVMEKSIIQGD